MKVVRGVVVVGPNPLEGEDIVTTEVTTVVGCAVELAGAVANRLVRSDDNSGKASDASSSTWLSISGRTLGRRVGMAATDKLPGKSAVMIASSSAMTLSGTLYFTTMHFMWDSM